MSGGDSSDGESNVGQRFDRLPATASERVVAGRATRAEVLEYFEDRFAIPAETFDGFTFWEKGAGKSGFSAERVRRLHRSKLSV